MNVARLLGGAVCGVAFAASAQAAAIFPTFELQMESSSVVAGELTVATPFSNADGAWQPSEGNTTLFIPDFWDWDTSWAPTEATDITAHLVLDQPAGGLATQLSGTYANGDLTWSGPAEFVLGDGSKLTLTFDDDISYGYVDATAAYEAPAPVPLPAAGVLLLAGMAGLGGLARRRKAV